MTQSDRPQQKWEIASMTRITFARAFDLLVSALPVMIFLIFLPIKGWQGVLVNASISFVILVLYFIVLPYFMKGNTIGKKLFQISLKSSQKITFMKIFLREGFFILLPWLIALILKILAVGIFNLGDHENDDMTTNGFWIAFGIGRLGDLFYLIWAVFLFVTIVVQENHQTGLDIKFEYFVVKKNPIIEKIVDNNSEENNKVVKHIHLDENQPGNFDENVIKEIDEIE